MAFGDADRDLFLQDFGVPVSYGAATAKAILKKTDVGNPLPDQDNSNLGRLSELVIRQGALGVLSSETVITVDGTLMQLSTYDLIEEGGFTKLFVEPWNVTSLDRPPLDVANLVWAWDPDRGSGNEALVGPAGVATNAFWQGGGGGIASPGAEYVFFPPVANISFGDSLDNVWSGGLPFTIYLALDFNAADFLAPLSGAYALITKDQTGGNHEFLIEMGASGTLFFRVNYLNDFNNWEWASESGGGGPGSIGRHIAAFRFDPTLAHGVRCSCWWETHTFINNQRQSNGAGGVINNTASALQLGGLDSAGRDAPHAASYIYAYKTAHTFATATGIFGWIRDGKGWL